jgi:hypothetical protein
LQSRVDAAGTGTHDDDAAVEDYGFLDIVSNEHHVLLVALPDTRAAFPASSMRGFVERTEGLIE